MRKKLCVTIILLVIVLASFAVYRINKENDNKLEKITVAEVAHSVFYAPQYVAHGLGYFKEEGLDVNIVLTSGADNVMAAVLSSDAQIGFAGTEATIYVYNGGEKDYVMTFAGLTQKDGSFLVSRKKYDNFTLDDLKGKKVIGGRIGGMPEMTFEWALKQNNVDPENDLIIDTAAFKYKGAGRKALVYGGYTPDATVRVENADVGIKLISDSGILTYAPKEKIKESNLIKSVVINDEIINR